MPRVALHGPWPSPSVSCLLRKGSQHCRLCVIGEASLQSLWEMLDLQQQERFQGHPGRHGRGRRSPPVLGIASESGTGRGQRAA